tara:strand:- start:104 stop:508 length:405 start_codon:yes stop_codon:yes gene_type:complete
LNNIIIDRSVFEQYKVKMKKNNLDKTKEINLNLLRSIHKNPNLSQRNIAKNLGISLGKLNYLIQSLSDRGLVKIKNFSKSKNKLSYVYLLTPEGLNQKLKLTMRFMKIKLKEYDELSIEVKNNKLKNNVDRSKN